MPQLEGPNGFSKGGFETIRGRNLIKDPFEQNDSLMKHYAMAGISFGKGRLFFVKRFG